MLYLYSGFSDDFFEDIKPFLSGADGIAKRVALLIQGGPGYENYLDDYLKPMKAHGVERIDIVLPRDGGDAIAKSDMDIIAAADAVFIGGGYTPRYAELYAVDGVIGILKDKHAQGTNIGGLSAGAIIMNNSVKSDGKMLKGLGLVENMFVYPHFEEDSYGYAMIKDALESGNAPCYGLETNAFLEIDANGNLRKKGKGRVFVALNTDDGKAEFSVMKDGENSCKENRI